MGMTLSDNTRVGCEHSRAPAGVAQWQSPAIAFHSLGSGIETRWRHMIPETLEVSLARYLVPRVALRDTRQRSRIRGRVC